MAKESANAKEILQYYFPEMDVLNIKICKLLNRYEYSGHPIDMKMKTEVKGI
mgnify:FL=1